MTYLGKWKSLVVLLPLLIGGLIYIEEMIYFFYPALGGHTVSLGSLRYELS